jgi:hypothetical protein
MRYICFALLVFHAYGVVPTVDQNQLQQDITTTLTYGAMLGTILNKLSDVMSVTDQVAKLHSLQDVAALGGDICRICSPIDKLRLQSYIEQVNNDLCSQFSWAMNNITGIDRSIKSLQEVLTIFAINPKQAGIALQMAAVQTHAATANTMAQIQMMLAQTKQKDMAEEKLERQNTNEIYIGFRKSKL